MSPEGPRATESVRRLAAGVLMPGFVGPEVPRWLAEALTAGLGGVCLFGSNVPDPVRTRVLTDAIRELRPEAVVAIDEEGGDVTRLHARDGSPEPGNAVLGRLDDLAATAASARRIGLGLAAAGVDLDLAPSVDVNTDPDNPVIGVRSFGADPGLVARHSVAWVRGLQGAGVAACVKHFPGHGDTAVDSHLGVPIVDRSLASLRATELPPFAAAIAAGAAAVMTSHLMLPQLDDDSVATLSRPILTGLLREELGFAGVIVTDALDMAGAIDGIDIPGAAVRALQAGADLLCLGSDSADVLGDVVNAIVGAVEQGSLPISRLDDAAGRVRTLRAHPVDTAPPPDAPVGATRIAQAFTVSASAATAFSAGGDWTVVRLQARANAAVGDTGWGPFAAAAADAGSTAARRFSAWPRIDVDLDADVEVADAVPRIAGRVLVIGRDNHRHVGARRLIDALRAETGDEVVVVDMGWPSVDRRYADIATWGASRAVGAALLHLIGGSADVERT